MTGPIKEGKQFSCMDLVGINLIPIDYKGILSQNSYSCIQTFMTIREKIYLSPLCLWLGSKIIKMSEISRENTHSFKLKTLAMQNLRNQRISNENVH
jgi:hypothetical protein